MGLRSERLPCPETSAPHSVQKTSRWGLITLSCWILPSYSTFVLVVSAKSPNYIAEAFLSSLCFIELCQASETNVYNQCSFWEELWEDKVEDNKSLTRRAPLRMTRVNNNCVRCLEFMHEAGCAVAWKHFAVCKLICVHVFTWFHRSALFLFFVFFSFNVPECEGDIVSAFPRHSSPQGYFN